MRAYAVASPWNGAPAPRFDAHATTTDLQHVCVHHRRFYIGVAQQFLHGADVIT